MPLGRFLGMAASGAERLELVGEGGGAVVIELAPDDEAPAATATATATATALVASLPLVVIGVGPPDAPGADLVDLVVADPAAAAELLDAVERHPIAATALALLLRAVERRTVPAGLVAESSTYSLLQAGPEHRAWLAGRPPPPGPPEGPRPDPVLVDRRGDHLRITLNRPEVHNALDAAMREALLDALAVASADPSVPVVIDGAGPSFCSGGDLAEFGSLRDPASAHLLRLGRSLGYAVHALADRVTVEVHGYGVGSGLELAAFAGCVTATPDATLALPELGMGLVPGAGGTVSVTRRIGRHRAAWLVLTGAELDAQQALDWGLVDAIR